LNLEQQKYLEIVLKNVKQLGSMINDLLEVTRVQARKLTIDLECTSLSDAINYSINTLQGAATAKGITLSSDIEGRLPSACADPTRIRQILIILVDNAIKFTPANGGVKIQARMSQEDPNRLVLEVSDSGCGISPDMTERIFERLFRVSDSALGGRQGLGAGVIHLQRVGNATRRSNLGYERTWTRCRIFFYFTRFFFIESNRPGNQEQEA
jgi:signal transduction histidine kinase